MIRGLLLALALGAATFADDAPSVVSVKAHATPDTTTIGTRVRYEVEVSAPPGMEIMVAQPAERIGDMEIVDFGTEAPSPTKDGRVVFRRWWQLVAWSPGHHLLVSPKVQYRAPGGELADAPTDDVGVTVTSLLERAPQAADIRDIKPPEPIPVDWRPYEWLAGGAIALALLAYAVYFALARRRRVVAAPPPPPPHVVAVAALDALRARALVEKGALKEFYSALSDIVRRYLEDRFGVRAPEMTTEEFLLATSRDGRLAAAHRRLLGDFLVESDLVKFARHVPTIADSERAFTAARRFIDETTPVTREAA
ncbi:MAG TPA: hypothetical protein VMS22_26150 [Candidatus Eisenbacteria bacterium]|nr:hypothetical protein [Candidatus Eisenbacteria bacterium]